MSGYVTFDSNGVFGPVITLLFQTPTTEDALKATTKLLQTNFHHLSINRIYPTHRGEFCAYILKRINDQKQITPEKVIKTGFFEKMQVSCLSSSHERVKNILVPAMLLQARPFVPAAGEISCHQDKINEWIAQFLESYLTESQLNDHCNYQELLGSNPEISAERTAIGTALYQKYMDKEMTERDLDAILQGMSTLPDGELLNADHPDIVREFTEKYNALFALAGDFSKMLSDTIRSSLDTTFRKKFFPKALPELK